jgi:hypothetical protein
MITRKYLPWCVIAAAILVAGLAISGVSAWPLVLLGLCCALMMMFMMGGMHGGGSGGAPGNSTDTYDSRHTGSGGS